MVRLNGMPRGLVLALLGLGVLLAVPATSALAADGNADKGKHAIESYGCVACHVVPGVNGPRSDIGPPLEHIAKRTYIAGVLANTKDNMVRWLRDPPAVDPRTAMPNMNISEANARDIAAYLYTLD
jgi:cytochrome c